MELNEDLVRRLGDLARIELSDEEVRLFAEQISRILGYVDQLNSVNAQVEPMTHPFELQTPMREDVAEAFSPAPDGSPRVLESAPESLYDGFKVPPIL